MTTGYGPMDLAQTLRGTDIYENINELKKGRFILNSKEDRNEE